MSLIPYHLNIQRPLVDRTESLEVLEIVIFEVNTPARTRFDRQTLQSPRQRMKQQISQISVRTNHGQTGHRRTNAPDILFIPCPPLSHFLLSHPLSLPRPEPDIFGHPNTDQFEMSHLWECCQYPPDWNQRIAFKRGQHDVPCRMHDPFIPIIGPFRVGQKSVNVLPVDFCSEQPEGIQTSQRRKEGFRIRTV